METWSIHEFSGGLEGGRVRIHLLIKREELGHHWAWLRFAL